MTYPARHISISIKCDSSEVYEYTCNPAHLPDWAAGLAGGISRKADHWVADSPFGQVKVRFADINNYGVLDHWVELPDGQQVYNPVRVLPNHQGSELVFSLYRLPGVTDEAFEADTLAVAQDLQRLKTILEASK